MTREEREDAIIFFEEVAKKDAIYAHYSKLAIEALQQEPCEDAIRRDELLKAMDTWDKFGYTETGCFVREPKNDYVKYIHYDDVIKCIKGMPSVTPQQKSEWQHAHEILKAHSDGANAMLDIIRAEIMQLDYNLESIDYDHNGMAMTEEVHMICREELLQIIDRYRVESEE